MKEYNDLLKKNDYRALSYKKNGNVVIADTNKGLVVIKKNNNKSYIYDYLDSRNFNYYPKIIESSNYIISEYVKDTNIDKEQKAFDLINLISLLHNKTTYYKNVSVDEYKKIYEDLSNNFLYLYEYYNDLITIIDSFEYMSPSNYLLARNISFIFETINQGKVYIENWLELIKDKDKMRVSVVHNNLSINHYIRNNHEYLISWDKSKIDMPIFDLYNFYNNHFNDFDFYDLLKKYENTYPLKDYERNLFFILITMPNVIKLSNNELNNCKVITKEINRINKSKKLIEQYKKSTK